MSSDDGRNGRFNIYFNIAILCRDGQWLGEPSRGISVNVSRGEALCLVRGRFAPGERITLEVSQKRFLYPSSGNGKALCRGRVLDVKRAGEGLSRTGEVQEIIVGLEEGLEEVGRLINDYIAWEQSTRASGMNAFTRAAPPP